MEREVSCPVKQAKLVTNEWGIPNLSIHVVFFFFLKGREFNFRVVTNKPSVF